MYVLQILNNIGFSKGIMENNYTLSNNEIEITKEQYNSIRLPCTIIIVDGVLFSWEHFEPEPVEEPIREKSSIELLQEENMLLKERILQLEVAEVNRKSKEIEVQILGGTI